MESLVPLYSADQGGFFDPQRGERTVRSIVLVQEMPHAGEYHGHSEPVGGGDYVVVADGSAGLDDGDGSGFGGFFDAVGEREKSVGGDNASGERRLRFHHGDFDGVDAAHLAGANADGGALFRKD